MTTQAKGPGQRALDGQVSQSRRAKASASPKAPVLGRSRTTFGGRDGSATVSMNLEQSEGLSVRKNAATSTKAGVASGTTTNVASLTDYVGNRGHDVVTNPFFRDDLSTGGSRHSRKTWKPNWLLISTLAGQALFWIIIIASWHG